MVPAFYLLNPYGYELITFERRSNYLCLHLGSILSIDWESLDLIDCLHPLDDVSEDTMLPIEERCILSRHDEELRAIGIATSICHRDDSTLVCERTIELILEGTEPERLAPSACPSRITSLDHEVSDHTMEYNPIIVSLLRETDEILDRLGC